MQPHNDREESAWAARPAPSLGLEYCHRLSLSIFWPIIREPGGASLGSRSRLVLAIGGCVIWALSACGPSGTNPPPGTTGPSLAASASAEPPCLGVPVAQVNLGSPYRAKGAEARTFFATNGSPVYFTARKFSHGGVLDPPQGVTAVYLGPRANLPTVARDSGEVSGTTVTLTVKEGEWEAAALPAGGYWVLTSTGGDLVVVGCSPGAVAPAS